MLKVPSPQTDVKHDTALEMPSPGPERRVRPASSLSRFSFRQPELDLDEFQPVAFCCLKRESWPRMWFIKLMSWPWFERVSILVILVNCVTLGMYNPFDTNCVTEQCRVLERLESGIYAFFLVEMLIKWVAMGLFGKKGYFQDSWNKLDFFIVAAGSFELAYGEGEYLSAVRSIRVLRPLRAINRVPSIRILVQLLLDTLPMLGNVLAICFFIFAIFGIIGVQLWQGLLRGRCFPDQLNDTIKAENNLSSFYRPSFDNPDYVCSLPGNNGLSKCDKSHFNHHDFNGHVCNHSYPLPRNASSSSCVEWNQYYTTCRDSGENIYYGSISFDNIGIATVAIFQIITLEGWTDIMYKIQDAHSFWNWVYFVVLILIGSYFMTNLCLVVITSQFQDTKQRETELLKQARLRSRPSVSTSSSYMQHGCYTQILHYLEHLCRRLKRRVRLWLKLEKPSKRRRVRPCLQLKNRGKDNVKSIHHHHHHYHYYHHYVHHPPCQCSSFEFSDSLPASSEPADICSGMSPPSAEHELGLTQDTQDSRNPKESKRILVVPQIQVFAQAATALYKDSDTNPSGEMVSTATANINLQGHDSSASVVTYSKTADPVAVAAQATTQTIEAACSCAARQSGDGDVHMATKAYEDFLDSSEDERGNRGTKKANSCYEKFRDQMKMIVEGTRFTRVIMVSIFLNTICMAVEHHGQPQKMTKVLEILNIIFTSIFAVEMLGKIIAFGPYGYIKDAYNLFDGIIVIVSLTDITADSDTSGISVLRSFRLLRIFKLVRFMPALQRQLSVMVKTLDNVMTFLALLALFIFTSSILGMHLFGGKYQFKNEDGQLVTSRANFDTLFWALVTVFQVLTQEDWNVVLYDGMRTLSSWAALYFMFLMIIGNYILFNLLVAILVEGFADHTENERLSLKGEKDPDAVFFLSKPERRCAGQSEKELAVSWPNINAMEESLDPRHLTRCKSAPGGRNQSQKPQRSMSYLHVLTVDALESEHSAEETGNKYERARCASPEEEDTSLVPLHSRLNNRNSSVGKSARSSCLKRRELWSFYIFSPENRFRKLMVKMHSHVWFDRIVLFFIMFNCVVMALEEPGLDQNSKTGQFIYITQYIFTAIFTIEMCIKVISLGLIVGPNTYLRSGWNIVDGVLVLFSLVDLVISLATDTHGGILGVLRVFRAFRTLRPLRVINRAPGLKLVVETLLTSLKPIGNVVLIAATFFTIFGILGVQLFKGKFYSCHDVPYTIEIKNKSQCLSNTGKWLNNEYNFDHLARALLTLFVFATRDGWVTIMYSGVDAVGVDEEPQRDHSKWNVLYFVAFLLLAGFVVLNMLVGIVVENFHKCRNELLKEQNAAKNAEKNNEMNNDKSRSNSVSDIDYESFPAWRQKVFLLVTHDYFDLAIAVVIAVNVLCMAMEHYDQPENLTLFLKYANYVFTIMFIIEAALKILALGFKNYFRNKWNCLDMMIVVLSIGGIILDELATSNFPMNPTIIRVMRVLRITRVLKLLKTAEGIRSLLDTVGNALPQVANLGLLFLLLFFIFGALGMELFGNISCEKVECEGLDTHAHFKNFGYSVLTLFRVSTGDNWNGILKDTINSKRCETEQIEGCEIIQNFAPIYFASFVLITQFVLLNVVVAVMMKHLEESKFEETMKKSTPRTPRLSLEKRTPDTPRRSKSSLRFSKGSQQSLRSRRSESGILKKKGSTLNVDGGQRRAKSMDEIRNNNLRLSSGSDSDCCFEKTTIGKDCNESCGDLRQRKPSLEMPVKENKENEISEKFKIPHSVLQIVEMDDYESSKVPVKSSKVPVKSSGPVAKTSELRLSQSSESLAKSSEFPMKGLEQRLTKSSESLRKSPEPPVKDSDQVVKGSTPITANPNDKIGAPRRKAVVKNNFVENEIGLNENKETTKLEEGELQSLKETKSKEKMEHNNQEKIKDTISQEKSENELLNESEGKKEKNKEKKESGTKQPGHNQDEEIEERMKNEIGKDREIKQIDDLKETEEHIYEKEKMKEDVKKNDKRNKTIEDNENKQLKKLEGSRENLKERNDMETPAFEQNNFKRNRRQQAELDLRTETKSQETEGSNRPKETLELKEGFQVNSVDNNNKKVDPPEGVSKGTDTQLEGNSRTRFHGIRLEPLADNVTKLPSPASNA